MTTARMRFQLNTGEIVEVDINIMEREEYAEIRPYTFDKRPAWSIAEDDDLVIAAKLVLHVPTPVDVPDEPEQAPAASLLDLLRARGMFSAN